MSRSRKLADLLDANGDVKISNLDNSTSLPLAGGAMTGAITTNSTFDNVDIATRDGVLTSTTTTANAALPKAGGAMTGAITTNSTFDTRDVATDGTKLDTIETNADVTDATNVTAAGALMDSELAGLAAVKATTGTFLTADQTKLDGIETNATADQTAAQIKTALENGIDSVHYVDGSIDTVHIGDDQVTADKLANSINTEIAANTAKTGITSGQASAITANTAKTGITSSQATAITAALPKAGGTMTGSVIGSTDTDATNTGNVTLDFSANQNFVLTLQGATTLVNPSTETVGQSGFITFIQDGTGGRTVAVGTDYETAGAAGITLSTAASATDIVPYVVVASNRILLGTPQLAFA
tara:strand:+ start:396 stop:1466 length:1071 start_codon:yes stop_codon:yes gene_type:complete